MIQDAEALGARVGEIAAKVKALPSDVEVENLSMLEYRESAQDFVKQCLDYVQQIQEVKSKVHSSQYIVENLQLFLVEMREIIGDADLIRLTDNIFQRVQLREI